MGSIPLRYNCFNNILNFKIMIYKNYITKQIEKVLKDEPTSFSLLTNVSFDRLNLLHNVKDEFDYLISDVKEITTTDYYKTILNDVKEIKSNKSKKKFKTYSQSFIYPEQVLENIDISEHQLKFSLSTLDKNNSIKLHYSKNITVIIKSYLNNYPDSNLQHVLDYVIEKELINKKMMGKDDYGDLYSSLKVINKVVLDVELTLDSIILNNYLFYYMALYESICHLIAKKNGLYLNTFTINLLNVEYGYIDNFNLENKIEYFPFGEFKRK